MAVDYIGFEKELADGKRFNVYLFEGEDAYFGVRALLLLKNSLITEPELNYAEFDDKVDVSEIIGSFNMYPFISEYRLTVVKEFYPNKDSVRQLTNVLNNPNDRGILAIINQKASIELKKLPNVCVVDCAKWKDSVIARWIRKECDNNGVAIDGFAANKIAEYCLCDMFRVSNETKKLCDHVGNGGIITEKLVNELVWQDNEHQIYNLTDQVCRRKFDNALTIIKDMMSKGETSQRLSVSLYNHFRRLLHILISGESDAELANIFKMKDFAIKKSREQAKFFKVRSLKRTVDYLTEIDFKGKRGLLNIDETFWLAIFKIMTED